MDWVKLATDYYTDERVEKLEEAAELIFVRGLARAGELERGGFIPESSVPRLARRRRYATLVRALVSSGLWTKVDGGYQIAGWSDWQGELDALAARRTTDRERARQYRRRKRVAAESTPSRDNGHPSRDVTQGELDVEVEGVKGGDLASGMPSTGRGPPVDNQPREPPARHCPRHPRGTTRDCGPCKDARLAHQAWEAERRERWRTAARCPTHPDQLAGHCQACRSERLARKDPP